MTYDKYYKLICSVNTKKIGLDVDYAITITDKVNLIFYGSNSKIDWRTNFTFLPKCYGSLIVHSGFLKAWLSAVDTIKAEVEKVIDGKELRIIGHSFGGAMSILAAVTFKEYSPEVITFGSPKIVYYGKRQVEECGTFTQFAQYNDMVSYCIPFCRHINLTRVGEKFNLIKMLKKTEEYHTSYDDESLYLNL